MDCYIVRIYRRDEEDKLKVSGLVETVGKEGAEGFCNAEELWNIVGTRKIKKIRSACKKQSFDTSNAS